MVGSDLVAGAAQAAIAILVLSGTAQIWHLVVLQVVRGMASSFFLPAAAGIVPQVVVASRLQEANALLGLTRSSTQVLGTAEVASRSPRSGQGGRWPSMRRPTFSAPSSSSVSGCLEV